MSKEVLFQLINRLESADALTRLDLEKEFNTRLVQNKEKSNEYFSIFYTVVKSIDGILEVEARLPRRPDTQCAYFIILTIDPKTRISLADVCQRFGEELYFDHSTCGHVDPDFSYYYKRPKGHLIFSFNKTKPYYVTRISIDRDRYNDEHEESL